MHPWLGCTFAQTALVRCNWLLRQGHLLLPGAPNSHSVPLCPLERLGDLGPDGRDIHDGFTRGRGVTPYPALWNNDSDEVTTIDRAPNLYLSPRARAAAGRPERPANLLWPKAARTMLAVRLRFNTHRLVAARVSEAALSNVWYPFSLRSVNEDAEKALTLWLNSTLGLLVLAGHRVPTQGAWVQFKKPTWGPLPVLNVAALSDQQLRQLASAYDQVSHAEVLPIRMMDVDPVRQEIDHVFGTVLGLPPISAVRNLLVQEPIIQNASIGVPSQVEPVEERQEQFELLR